MVVRITLKTTVEPFKDFEVYADSFVKLSEEYGKEAFATIQEPLLDELRFYPPVPPNSRYVRTFRLRRGWKAGIVDLGGNKFGFMVSNDVNYTQWVVGSLAQAESAAARFQRDFHRANGWFLATKTVKFWFEAYLENLNKRFERELSQFGTITNKQRAFTSKTR